MCIEAGMLILALFALSFSSLNASSGIFLSSLFKLQCSPAAKIKVFEENSLGRSTHASYTASHVN